MVIMHIGIIFILKKIINIIFYKGRESVQYSWSFFFIVLNIGLCFNNYQRLFLSEI